MMELKALVTEKHPFDNRGESFFSINFLENFDYQNFDARIKINGFLVEFSSTEVRLSFEIAIDEIKLGVAEKTHFE